MISPYFVHLVFTDDSVITVFVQADSDSEAENRALYWYGAEYFNHTDRSVKKVFSVKVSEPTFFLAIDLDSNHAAKLENLDLNEK
jgi:hypothetical protein